MLELARCTLTNSERDFQRVVRKFHLALEIPLTILPKTPGVIYPGQIAALSLNDWLRFLIDKQLWCMLVGLHRSNPDRERQILRTFWQRFKQIEPHHRVFQLAESGEISLETCCPVLLHGDEGRGRKKSGFLVISYHSYIGTGTAEANKQRRKRYVQFPLNYTNDLYCTRFLSCVLPRMFKDECAFEDLLLFVSQDCRRVLREGVLDDSGQKYTMRCLHNTGDWQWLQKSGHLNRSYQCVEKRPRASNGSVLRGICHQCEAGQEGVAWEGYDIHGQPQWKSTFLRSSPFTGNPALNQVCGVPGKEALFYAWDLFHSYHLGVGKSCVATCLCLASECMSATQVDERFSQLTELYLTYCTDHHLPSYITQVTKSTVGWPDTGTYPNGYWSKGHVTTTLAGFFEDWAGGQQQFPANHDLLCMCRRTSREISKCLRALYAADVWLSRSQAETIAKAGLAFLAGYQDLAFKAFQDGRALFALMPKGHAMEHIFVAMLDQLSNPRCDYVLSPLCHAVQIDEGWVGVCSRLARRTSPSTVIVRVLQRTLLACMKHWKDRGYLPH